jgi:hypothetical protein
MVALNKLEQQALSLMAAFEKAGKTVSRVTVDGRRIEIDLATDDVRDEFDRINMHHGQTRAS